MLADLLQWHFGAVAQAEEETPLFEVAEVIGPVFGELVHGAPDLAEDNPIVANLVAPPFWRLAAGRHERFNLLADRRLRPGQSSVDLRQDVFADPVAGLLERAIGVDSVVLPTVLGQDTDTKQMDRTEAVVEEFGVDEVFQKLRCRTERVRVRANSIPLDDNGR
jgi:hypothetical protein